MHTKKYGDIILNNNYPINLFRITSLLQYGITIIYVRITHEHRLSFAGIMKMNISESHNDIGAVVDISDDFI